MSRDGGFGVRDVGGIETSGAGTGTLDPRTGREAARYAKERRPRKAPKVAVLRPAGSGLRTARRAGLIFAPTAAILGGSMGRTPAPRPHGERDMTIKVGDRLPAGTLSEYFEVETNGCSIGPNPVKVEDFAKGRKVVIFGLPGAFTPTCSAKHVPSYLQNFDKLKAKGVAAVACLSVNDAFVMGAWAREQRTGDRIRMLGDGSAAYTRALGLELDLVSRGMGVRCQRFSMLVDNGVVKSLKIEGHGKFEVRDGETMLKQLG